MSLTLKINARHRDNPNASPIISVNRINNAEFNLPFNSLASTFSFDYLFDPTNQTDAEVVCVTHMHECQWFYNGKLFLTGYMLSQEFENTGKPTWVKLAGYSKSGSLNKSWTPAGESLETEGLTFKQIVTKFITPFNSNGIGIIFGSGTDASVNSAFKIKKDSGEKDLEDKENEVIEKSAKEITQNVGSYISDLAKKKNIVLSHDEKSNVLVIKPNTKSKPILNLDFTDLSSDWYKIPGVKTKFTFNGEPLHTEITVVQQADDEGGTNAVEVTKKNPLIPIKKRTINWPITHVVDSGNEFTVNEACNYEMGLEVREAAKLVIELGTANINGELIQANNTITVKDPTIFAYKKITWFIESVVPKINSETETCTLNCVLPFGYDFDFGSLSNVWIDPHENLPRIT